VHDLNLTEVEIDEFWSFVGRKRGRALRRSSTVLPRPAPLASGGAA
jgi:hypothetical protein